MLMSVMLISIMFVNMTSAAQIKDIKGTRVERQYSNHYSAQFNELWDSFGRSEISIYDINYNINATALVSVFVWIVISHSQAEYLGNSMLRHSYTV